jgi:hypothetical protein
MFVNICWGPTFAANRFQRLEFPGPENGRACGLVHAPAVPVVVALCRTVAAYLWMENNIGI